VDHLLSPTDLDAAVERKYGLISELYPVGRSITVAGFEAPLRRLCERIPLEVHEVPGGTQVFSHIVHRDCFSLSKVAAVMMNAAYRARPRLPKPASVL
jgi:aminopeptidase-like protein